MTDYRSAHTAIARSTDLVAQGQLDEATELVGWALLFYLTHQCNSPETARLSQAYKLLKDLR
jgi:hypothetical protein